jgi:Domain of unknown function (DUF4878)
MKKLKPFVPVALILLALVSCNLGSSPTKTFKTFFEAQKKKDIPGMKKTLSKASLEMMEKAAKTQNKTVDQAITEGFNSPGGKADKLPETRNEKIDGDNATLEVNDEETKKWETLYFVKEDAEWKIALDKTIEEMFKKLGTP